MNPGAIFAALLATSAVSFAGILDSLSSDDQASVKDGKQIVVAESLAGYPWPRVQVYQTVKATPEELMAVFFDYNNAKDFVPNCMQSEISKEIDPRTFEVFYKVDVPIFPDEAYTIRNQLKGNHESMRVDWKLIKATSVQESEGSLVVEPMGTGAVLCYTNLVKPSSKAAVLLKGLALSQMKDTVNAIVSQAETLRTSNPGAMDRKLKALESALGD